MVNQQGSASHAQKKRRPVLHQSASPVSGVEETYGFGFACGCVFALCFLL